MILDKTIQNNVMLQYSLKNKKFSLQFLPQRLESISNIDKIDFNGKILKTSYLIDIIHNMILKYYFKKENYFALNALILKEKYGYLYNYYIEYLKENKIIFIEKNYLKGSNSRIYSLNESIFNESIKRYKNSDKFLLKKYINKYYQYEIDRNNIIDRDIKDKLILDLFSVKIQYDKSIFYLNSLKVEDIDIFNRNKYSVDSISDSHIFYHFDSYGRMHTNFTILKSFIRKNCLLIDGEETFEIDIKNSQPLFLAKLIIESNTRWVNKEEFKLFYYLVSNGIFYQYLIENSDIKDKKLVKDVVYKVLFGKNRINSKNDIIFSRLFPTIHNFIKLYKKENNDYKILAHTLQKLESELIYNNIIKTIMIINEDIKIITVHDSIIAQKKYQDIISSVFNEKISMHFKKDYII